MFENETQLLTERYTWTTWSIAWSSYSHRTHKAFDDSKKLYYVLWGFSRLFLGGGVVDITGSVLKTAVKSWITLKVTEINSCSLLLVFKNWLLQLVSRCHLNATKMPRRQLTSQSPYHSFRIIMCQTLSHSPLPSTPFSYFP